MAKAQPAPKRKAAGAGRRRNRQPGYAASAKLRGEILDLRVLGLTIGQIAERVKRAPSVVHGHLERALEDQADTMRDQAEKLRALAYGRLERMLAKAMLKALNGAGDLKAMREAQRLILAQARVMGFEASAFRPGGKPGDADTTLPPGHWTLPMRPDLSLEAWQRAAEDVWQQQQQRDEAESQG